MGLLVFKIIHIIGAFFLFVGFGGLLGLGENRGNINKLVSALHGTGLLLLFIAGFGMQGMGKMGFPLWLVLKIVLWLVMVALFVFAKKDKISPAAAIWGSLAAGAAIAALCILKQPV